MVLWFYGFMVLWFYGFMVLWFYGFIPYLYIQDLFNEWVEIPAFQEGIGNQEAFGIPEVVRE